MKELSLPLKRFLRVLTLAYATFFGLAAHAELPEVERLLTDLRQSTPAEALRISAEILERWSSSGSPAMDYLLMRGKAAIEAKDYAEAIHHLTALTDHAPQFAEGWNQRATAFFYAERYGEALHDIEQTLALNPNHFNALTGLGLILQAMGYEAEALQALESVLAIHPHAPDVEQAVTKLRASVGGTAL